jgi:hypothetical protein
MVGFVGAGAAIRYFPRNNSASNRELAVGARNVNPRNEK